MQEYIAYIWLAVVVIAAIVEGCTAQLVSIWIVAGGVAALVAQLCGAEIWLQAVIFVAVTFITLLATRPLVKRAMKFKKEDTNAGRYLGKSGIVIMEIDNAVGQGQVNVLGSIWTARSEDGNKIPEGTQVWVKSIEGVKLIVEEQK